MKPCTIFINGFAKCDLKNVNSVFRIVKNESNVSPSVTSNTAGCSQVCGTPHVINRVNGIFIITHIDELKTYAR